MMQRILLAATVGLVIALSGCITLEAEADLHRDKSMDLRFGMTSDYDRIRGAMRPEFTSTYENGTGEFVNTSDGFFYEWERVRPPVVRQPSDGDTELSFMGESMNVTESYSFPLSYTVRVEFRSEGMGPANTSGNDSGMGGAMAGQFAEQIGFDFTLDPFGEIQETNGERTGDGAVTFDMTEQQTYYVEFSDPVWNQIGVGEACQEVWDCGAWSSCTNGTRERSCEAVQTCDSYMYRPNEVEQCGPGNNELSLGGPDSDLTMDGGSRQDPMMTVPTEPPSDQ